MTTLGCVTLACTATLIVGCTSYSAAPPAGRPGDSGGNPLTRVLQIAQPLERPVIGGSPGLDALTRVVGDAQIVMLGEPWHGDGAAIRLRAELVRHLHKNFGFDVLAFESDFFAINRGWSHAVRTGSIDRFAAENIYPFWSQSAAARPLWRYVRESQSTGKPLAVTGIDPKHVGAESRRTLPILMDSLLTRTTELTAAQRTGVLRVLHQYLHNEQQYRPTPPEQRMFIGVLEDMEGALGLLPAPERNAFVEQQVRNLRAAVRYSWSGTSRDLAMGDNLAWVATQLHPGKRIIVWAHNNHIVTDKWMYFAASDSVIRQDVRKRSTGNVGRFTYLGSEAKRFFGPKVVSIAFLSHQGRYSPEVRTNFDSARGAFEYGDLDSVAVLPPTPRGSIEAALAEAGFEMAVVDLRPLRGTQSPLRARAFGYVAVPPLAMRYWEGFDALVFIRSTFGLNEREASR